MEEAIKKRNNMEGEMRRSIGGAWHYHTKDCSFCNPMYKIIVTNTANLSSPKK